ncbi:MAG: lysylphosphatidylglycerol synthase transmembrane domain-containing protein [Gammaproteobacteria bacterium]|nr:lysylphosphatidylglycerol synthase transmembrane domain-containing protein [Gammaproteobacteria bacterium]
MTVSEQLAVGEGLTLIKKSGFRFKKTVLVVSVKLLLTFLAFYVISKRVTFNPVDYLNESNINYFLVGSALAILLIIVQASRWSRILNLFGTEVSLKKSLVAVWFGHLINHIVPTAAAGDLLRSYTLRHANLKHGKWKWLGAFFLEKYCAATSALLIASVALTTSIHTKLPLILMAFILLLTLSLVIAPMMGVRLSPYFKFKRIHQLVARVEQMSVLLLQSFMDRRGRYAFFSSVLINFGMCVVFYLIALGLGVEIQFAQCLFVVPVFTLLAALPISFAGWGVRELSCVGLLGYFDVSSENALIVSVMYGLLFFLSSLPGILAAYPFFASMRRVPAEGIC